MSNVKTRFLTKQEEVEEIDLGKEWQELKTLEKDTQKLEEKIETYLKVLR